MQTETHPLPGTAAPLLLRNSDPVLMMAPDDLEESPEQARRRYDPQELEALKASVRRYGFIVPLLVQDQGGQRLRVISGHRRLRVARELGLQVPCLLSRTPFRGAAEAEVVMAANQQQPLDPFELFWTVVRTTWEYHRELYDPALSLEQWMDLLRYVLDPGAAPLEGQPEWLRLRYREVMESLDADLKAFGLPAAQLRDRLIRYRAMLPVVQRALREGRLSWEGARSFNGWVKRARRLFPEHPALGEEALWALAQSLQALSLRELREALQRELARLGAPRREVSEAERTIRRLYRRTARLEQDRRQEVRERLRLLEQELKDIEALLEQP